MALPQNPHDANPPDYRAERYAPTRQPLVEHCNISHEVAAQRLIEIWTAQNTLERLEWDARQEAEAEQARLEEDNLLERQREEELIRVQEEEALQQEEKKKNRTKFLPFNDVKVSSTVPVNPSPHALRKLRKGEYLELHHFTNKGLAEAHSISHSVDDDALALMQDEHGTHSFVPISAAKAKETIIPDHELTWPQIDEATHRMLLAMKECGWGADRIDAHLHFWMNLSAHEWRHDAEDAARQALIVYQATYRRRWHAALGTSSSFNLKYIDEEALIKIKFNITSKLPVHTAITNKAKEASTFPLQRETFFLILTPPIHDTLPSPFFLFGYAPYSHALGT